MNNEQLQIFKTIGKLQAAISSSDTLNNAIRTGMKLILENSMADYAIIWYISGSDDNTKSIKPYYWICPSDMTTLHYFPGEGIPGRVFLNKKREILTDFEAEADEQTKSEFSSFSVGSLVCVPLVSDEQNLGCVEFIKTKENGRFSEDEADVCELLCMMGQYAIEVYDPLPKASVNKPVILSARDITKSFQNGDEVLQVLKKVNFDVFEGEFLCFLGESGSGKSTILNIIGGILDADGGSLKFKGKELIGLSRDELTVYRRDNIGFIFQSYNLMPNLNIRDNLNLIAELVDEPADSLEMLELVGIADKALSYPSQLSGGQQQRASIARALVKKPCLVLADEPTAALDYETSVGVLSVFENIKKSGATLVMVTHNEAITHMADRIIRFKGGRSYETIVNSNPVKASELEW